MSEKARILRKQERPESASSAGPSEAAGVGSGTSEPQLVAAQAQLAQTHQELEKALKSSRTLARHCARVEQEMRRREESFALACEFGSDLLFRLRRDGKVQVLSPKTMALLGYAPEALDGRYFQDLVLEDDRECLRRYLQGVLRGPMAEGLTIRLRHAERGCRPVRIHCRAVPHPQTQVLEILGIASPAGPARPPASPLEDLAGSLAHELNQPLTSLAVAARACSQLARLPGMDQEEFLQALDQLAVQAERAAELVRSMRQLALRGKSRHATFGVRDLIQASLAMLTAELDRERVSRQLHIAGDLPNIEGDRIQLEQVLVNLIRNAIEAMNATPLDQRVLTFTATRKGSEVVLLVGDAGHGLAPGIAERLFQPYQTTKPQGMGLGLAVSRAILEAHAGRLWIEPTHGPGATFGLALPLRV